MTLTDFNLIFRILSEPSSESFGSFLFQRRPLTSTKPSTSTTSFFSPRLSTDTKCKLTTNKCSSLDTVKRHPGISIFAPCTSQAAPPRRTRISNLSTSTIDQARGSDQTSLRILSLPQHHIASPEQTELRLQPRHDIDAEAIAIWKNAEFNPP
ncbi:hypothetical protein BJ508DRAFT_333564 [Ascobolus immersus RN42]|uniref:Uncharacterized protein n=1 Tax=Ascobolus immersus RN42 TaxID=1160509 RepID=A0A3N4HKZ4_ASCIM|nr:hypothetical protein BJ508DRAFT_333564 [Ascobolus immersus RN42]